MAKPTDFPDWATTEVIDPTSGESNRVEPAAAKKDIGWERAEQPTRQWWNWVLWTLGRWVRWVNDGTAAATASTIMERDSAGRSKVADPAVAGDVVNRGWVEGRYGQLGTAGGEVRTNSQNDSRFILATTYEEATVELGGDFDSGQQVKCVRHGDVVTITALGDLSHASASIARSAAGAVPSSFRPSSDVHNLSSFGNVSVTELTVKSGGQLEVDRKDWAGSAYTTTGVGAFVITYAIT